MLAEDIAKEFKKNRAIADSIFYVYLQPEERWTPFHKGTTERWLSDYIIPEAVHLHKSIILRKELTIEEIWRQSTLSDDIRKQLIIAMDKISADIIMPLKWHDRGIYGIIILKLKEGKKNAFTHLEDIYALQKSTVKLGYCLSSVLALPLCHPPRRTFSCRFGFRFGLDLDLEKRKISFSRILGGCKFCKLNKNVLSQFLNHFGSLR